MECWIRNGSPVALKNMRAQVCVMFKGAPAFAAQTNDNKVLESPRTIIKAGGHTILTEWEVLPARVGQSALPVHALGPALPRLRPRRNRPSHWTSLVRIAGFRIERCSDVAFFNRRPRFCWPLASPPVSNRLR